MTLQTLRWMRWATAAALAGGSCGLGAGLSARAQTPGVDVALACQDVVGVKQRCSLPTTVLVPRQEFQAEIRLTYRFACHGHAIGVVLASESQALPVAFGGSGATPAALQGYGPFVLEDRDPERTYRATLAGDCVIRIQLVEVRPSPLQLQLWKQAASDLARVIDAELGELTRAKALAGVIGWDDDQLSATLAKVQDTLRQELPAELPYDTLIYPPGCAVATKCGKLKDAADMPAGWALAAIANPELPDLVALKAQIESIKAGRPVYGQGDVGPLRQQLAADVDAAAAMIANGKAWINVIDADMKALVSRLEHLRDHAAGA